MKKNVLTAAGSGMLFLLLLASNCLGIEFRAGVSAGPAGVRGYYASIGEYYNLQERDIMMMKRRHILDTQIPVVMFIASKANVSPDIIVKMRSRGMTWMSIARKFGMGAEDFYVQAGMDWRGTMYERSYRYFNAPRSRWNRIKLSDSDIVNFVNLRFVSDYYGYRPEQVMKMRFKNGNFVDINNRIRDERINASRHPNEGNGGGEGYNNGGGHNENKWNKGGQENNGGNENQGHDNNKWNGGNNANDRNNGNNENNNPGNNNVTGGNNGENNGGGYNNGRNSQENSGSGNAGAAAPAVNTGGNSGSGADNSSVKTGDNNNNNSSSGSGNAGAAAPAVNTGGNSGKTGHGNSTANKGTDNGNNSGAGSGNPGANASATPATDTGDNSGSGVKTGHSNNGVNSTGEGSHTDNGNNKDNGANGVGNGR